MIGAITVFILLPVFSSVIEKYILANKVQTIKDAVDMANVATYMAIDTLSLGKQTVSLGDAEVWAQYKSFLAKNLGLDENLCPLPGSIAEAQVTVNSLILYNGGFPRTCPGGTELKRPSVHSDLTVPVKPTLYTRVILDYLEKDFLELKIHVDSDIPVNN